MSISRSRKLIEGCVVGSYPELDKVIVAIDPPVTAGQRADSCGLIIAGRAGSGRAAKAYILHDGTVQGLSPEGWAQRAMSLAQGWDADYMLAEVNQGGDLVTSVLHAVDHRIPIKKVRASRGKTARAEPVVMLYEQGRVKHCEHFTELEDEMAVMGTAAQTGSPDRADALVWAVTELLLQDHPAPRIRQL